MVEILTKPNSTNFVAKEEHYLNWELIVKNLAVKIHIDK